MYMLSRFKVILVICLLSFFSIFVSAQEEGDIACEDLPSALRAYNQDVQLDRNSLKRTLKEFSTFLESASGKGEIVQSELLKMIQDLEDVSFLMQENEMILSSRGSDIEYFVQDCLSSANN